MSEATRDPRPRSRARHGAMACWSACVCLAAIACADPAAFAQAPSPARSTGSETPPETQRDAKVSVEDEWFLRELKRLEVDLLHAGARAKFKRLDQLDRKLARFTGGRPRRVLGARPARDLHEAGGPQGGRAGTSPRFVEGGSLEDVRANDRSGDHRPGSTQSEVSLAAWGTQVVAAWNDGEVFDPPGPVGFGYSRDGGATWTDGGGLPLGNGLLTWTSDPVVTVNERTGTFYMTALAIAGMPPSNAVGVLRGRFTEAGFAWDAPTVARVARDTLPDKPWIAADSSSGNLYLAYTTFVRTSSRSIDLIEFQRSTDDNVSWSPRMRLSSPSDDGLVHGARPALGPDGELHVVWGATDTSLASGGLDHLRIRRSNDGGASFGAEADPAAVYFNFGSGAPGYNRGFGFGFPGIAVDRSDGPYRGRVYVTWMESLNYFDDAPPVADRIAELEPNDRFEDATPFAIGETVGGVVIDSGDQDFFAFAGGQGQTVIFMMDSLSLDLDPSLRLFCTDRVTRLAFSAPVAAVRQRFLLFTLPESGTYALRVAPLEVGVGGYRIRSGWVARGPERGRDHRDVFVSHSDDGSIWSPPVVATDDPPWFDDWFPEVAVSNDGRPYLMWYDWREPGACGGRSHTYLARSDDGGDRWTSLGARSAVSSEWTAVGSNLAPNQGDYNALFAGDGVMHLAWADGREGDPDVRTARYDLASDPPPPRARPGPRIEAVVPNPAAGRLAATIRLLDGGPASADLFDLSGRRVLGARLVPGATRQVIHLETAGLRPGVFVLRVVQAGRAATARVAIVR